MSTMIYTKEEIVAVVKVETELTKLAFSISDTFGRTAISSSILNFKELIKNQKGNFVPALDLDYKIFIVAFSESLMKNITL